MPIVDRREFGGRFSVRENAQRLANYRYLEVLLMEMLAGWCHTTPQIAYKAIFGYHVIDQGAIDNAEPAQFCPDQIGGRLGIGAAQGGDAFWVAYRMTATIRHDTHGHILTCLTEACERPTTAGIQIVGVSANGKNIHRRARIIIM